MKFTNKDFKDLSFPEDGVGGDVVLLSEIADRANAKLEEWLKEAPIVFSNENIITSKETGKVNSYGNVFTAFGNEWFPHKMRGATKKAKLVCIEEIK